MLRESKKSRQQRVASIIKRLEKVYPDAHCELNFKTPLQLLIATILSAQCTDKQVNLVTTTLFDRYRTASDFAKAPLSELQSSIRRIGLFRAKAKNIKACCKRLVEHYEGEVPRTMDALTSLAGVGRKTANVVLGNAFGINAGVVVDTHVSRLSQRFHFTEATTPDKIEQDLKTLAPQNQWAMLSHWMIWHGRRRCHARKPDCHQCEVRSLCPAKNLQKVAKKPQEQP
ncbi:MAG: Endonuclease III [Verrucomicrobia subdivision 3 bacterium]|nr:Endonuclease III [Limisphaerales bacterium]MCS1414868.1 Endonuclease III [Limisphaerales bacterium]